MMSDQVNLPKAHRVKLILSGAVLPLALLVSATAGAQTVPSAGALNQQIERDQPVRPAKAPPAIHIEQNAAPAAPAADRETILVRQLRISGAQLYPDAALLALTGFQGQARLTLSDLRAMAAAITGHYRRHGYFLAQAYLPAQQIEDGTVTIAVLEGRYGHIDVRNNVKLPAGVVDAALAGVRDGDAVAIAPLESGRLMLSELAGVNVTSTLVPGASVGASDLIIDIAPGARASGTIDADNQGNRYTGANRLGASLYLNNLAGWGDVFSARAISSDAGMRYARLAWQAQLGRARAGAAYSTMHYRLGKEFAALQASGVADVASIYASYPLLRSRSHSLTAQIDIDDKTFRDVAAATGSRADKKARVAMASLNGDSRDAAGTTTYTLTWSGGDIAIGSAAALAADAATARANGRYDKLSVSATRLQNVAGGLSLYGAVSGQAASKNLDASEKMGLGGGAGVRAYPSGEAYGDQGYVLNLEARLLSNTWAQHLPGRLQWIGFVDSGSVTLNKHAWTAGQNRRTLSGVGIGANWVGRGDVAVNATLARKLGNAPTLSAPDSTSRFSIQLISYF
jgi:hemolysin activation/secretion protein